MSGYRYSTLKSAFGTFTLIASDEGICTIQLGSAPQHFTAQRDDEALRPYCEALQAYLDGQTQLLALPLDIQAGTPLQRTVWNELRRIAFGSTISYSELARRCGKPNAVRAIASACGKNPLPLLIPCHRVLAKDGSLGGFSLGLALKKQLLALEQASLNRAA